MSERDVLFDLAIAAGHLVTATDGMESIRAERQAVLDALRAASGILTEGGDAKQAPGDSLSSPAPKADAQPPGYDSESGALMDEPE